MPLVYRGHSLHGSHPNYFCKSRERKLSTLVFGLILKFVF